MPVDKKKLLKHLNQDIYCKLGISSLHGIGVFAIRAIPKGINPLKSLISHKEIKFSRKEIKALPRSVRKQIEIFCYCAGDEVLVPNSGLNNMDMAIYLNHSKKPNLRFKKNGSLETLRNIKAGEELVMDYDHSFGEKHIFK
jgi:SET domain-containing protein